MGRQPQPKWYDALFQTGIRPEKIAADVLERMMREKDGTAGVSGDSDQSIGLGDQGGRSVRPDPIPAQAVEPPQPELSPTDSRLLDEWSAGYARGADEAYADCERIAREEGKRWSLGYKAFSESLADAIAAKRKEVCGE